MKQKNLPLMSIVVLNWNGLENTKVCLEHLRKLDYPHYEIIIVDNGSKPEDKHYLSQQPDIIYIDNPVNRGFTGGHIDGLQRAQGEFIVLLNNDAVMKHDYLTKALAHFDDPSVATVGGRAYFWNDNAPILDETNPFYSYMNVNIFTGEAHMLSTDYNVTQEVNVISGSAIIVRRSVIDEIGYLYDGFFAYFEETDLFARMKRAGYKVLYDPKLMIWHRNGASSGSSSGSHFFFYQIFRNRFIFAVRNFEPWFLRRFLLIYLKVSLVSVLQYFRDPEHRVMHRAYAQAALYNVLRFPRTFWQRHVLKKQLGASHYNHQLFLEQNGVSIIIDATSSGQADIHHALAAINQDTNPLHEYILLSKDSQKLSNTKLPSNARHLIDKEYFSTHPLNLGCIAARMPWMTICTAASIPDANEVRQDITAVLGTKTEAISYSSSQKSAAPYITFHKSLFETTGGLGTRDDSLTAIINHAITYTWLTGSLSEYHREASTYDIQLITPGQDELRTIKKEIETNNYFAHSNTISWFGKLRAKYYRLFQITTIFQWLFSPRIPSRLKLARLKNIVVFTLKSQIRSLAVEFKHIRNEVLLYGRQYQIIAGQKKHIEQKLTEAVKLPSNIPVFIICYERVHALKQIVGWLEKQGHKKIVFIDNDSTYKPLLDYYNKSPYQVLRLYRNTGHTAPWSLGIIRSLVPNDFYIVTDPDIIPVKQCPDTYLNHFLDIHKRFFAYQKVGFGLVIDDLPDYYPLKQAVTEWESQFWKHPVEDGIYEAGVDTTFALYKPYTYRYTLHPSLRTGTPHVARHLPWYHNPADETEEDIYYRYRADNSVNSWNSGTLPDRYLKEMQKNSKK